MKKSIEQTMRKAKIKLPKKEAPFRIGIMLTMFINSLMRDYPNYAKYAYNEVGFYYDKITYVIVSLNEVTGSVSKDVMKDFFRLTDDNLTWIGICSIAIHIEDKNLLKIDKSFGKIRMIADLIQRIGPDVKMPFEKKARPKKKKK